MITPKSIAIIYLRNVASPEGYVFHTRKSEMQSNDTRNKKSFIAQSVKEQSARVGVIPEGASSPVSIGIAHGALGPSNSIALDGPNLGEECLSSVGQVPLFKYTGAVTHGMDKKLTDNKGRSLRVWPGKTVAHNLWDIFFGIDG